MQPSPKYLVGLLAATLLLGAVHALAGEPSTATGATVYVHGNLCDVVPGIYHNGSAWGTFDNTIDSNGWSYLDLTADGEGTSLEQAFAMGCLEAYFTHDLMFDYWMDFALNTYPGGKPGSDLLTFMKDQQQWLRTTVATQAPSGQPYWVGMQHLLQQFDGLVAGYAQFCSPGQELTQMDLYMLESMGDLEDLDNVFPTSGASFSRINRDANISNALKDTDCSGFIKVLPDNSDIVVGHSTWRDFYAMIRVYKVYHLSYAPAGVVSMSSSPGFLHSKDDFYATPNTVVIETTNSIFNKALYKKITTQWATTGLEWLDLFSTYNSGTYNNQWMVVQTTSFVPNEPLPSSNLLYILEQIPGEIQSADMTATLVEDSYWGSYNIPYFTEIYNASGYPAQYAAHGNDFSYSMCPRAQIFRRNQTSVTSVDDVRMLMRYNNYENDPLSNGDPVLGAVCARGDLQSSDPVAFGCVDSKVTTVTSNIQEVFAVSGPTHVQQPVFVFDPKFASTPHTGVVNVWDFEWTTFPPSSDDA